MIPETRGLDRRAVLDLLRSYGVENWTVTESNNGLTLRVSDASGYYVVRSINQRYILRQVKSSLENRGYTLSTAAPVAVADPDGDALQRLVGR